MNTASIGMTMVILAVTSAAQGAECIDAKSAKAGFILERPGIHSEFRPAAGGMVAVANKYQSQSPQSQYLFGGLIEVFRDSSTGPVFRSQEGVPAEGGGQEQDRVCPPRAE
ncbi:hypothetical protein [Mesorhizobium sp. M0040]|uniref:hypothetical protein n=1 Tax=Mesorhizobium sp. M0040 TaxID=2956855 RepID=UPI0033395888